jgi:uncharacterized membrane protein
MPDDALPAKKPITGLAGPYGHPFHPVLIPIPIGAWIISVVFDIASHVVDQPGFLTQASEWLIAIGIIGALLAAMVGALDLIMIPRGTRAFTVGLTHASLNLTVTVAFVINFLWRHGSYTDGKAVAAGPLVLSIISIALLGAAGYLGGMLAYHYGVRVAAESVQAEGYGPAAQPTGASAHRVEPRS